MKGMISRKVLGLPFETQWVPQDAPTSHIREIPERGAVVIFD